MAASVSLKKLPICELTAVTPTCVDRLRKARPELKVDVN